MNYKRKTSEGEGIVCVYCDSHFQTQIITSQNWNENSKTKKYVPNKTQTSEVPN